MRIVLYCSEVLIIAINIHCEVPQNLTEIPRLKQLVYIGDKYRYSYYAVKCIVSQSDINKEKLNLD